MLRGLIEKSYKCFELDYEFSNGGVCFSLDFVKNVPK